MTAPRQASIRMLVEIPGDWKAEDMEALTDLLTVAINSTQARAIDLRWSSPGIGTVASQSFYGPLAVGVDLGSPEVDRSVKVIVFRRRGELLVDVEEFMRP